MQFERYYAFIGARDLTDVPDEGLTLYCQVAHTCGKKGYLVKTGAAPGADQRAAETCLNAGGAVALYLPWNGYEATWVAQMKARHGERVWVADSQPMRHIQAVAAIAHHPAPEQLQPPVRKLMARNYLIVAETQGIFAIPRPPCQGGTAHGIKCGEVLGIPTYNLSVPTGIALFHARLKQTA